MRKVFRGFEENKIEAESESMKERLEEGKKIFSDLYDAAHEKGIKSLQVHEDIVLPIHDKHFGELQPPEQSEHVWHHVLSGSTVDKPESLVYDDRDHGAKSDTESELEKMKNNK